MACIVHIACVHRSKTVQNDESQGAGGITTQKIQNAAEMQPRGSEPSKDPLPRTNDWMGSNPKICRKYNRETKSCWLSSEKLSKLSVRIFINTNIHWKNHG